MRNHSSRRQFIQGSALAGAALVGLGRSAMAGAHQPSPNVRPGAGKRPAVDWGLQIGDVDVEGDRALIWSRTDRPARLIVEWSKDERFRGAQRVEGPVAVAETDFTARVDLRGLPRDSELFVRAYFENRGFNRVKSELLDAHFRTPAPGRRDIRFVWTGDTAGQGWGIDLGFGGMKAYEAMRRVRPDFFVHSGDNIYADGPLVPEVKDAAGKVIWRNAFLEQVPEKGKVAETLHEFRRHHLYNRYDANVRAFSAEVPQIWQWDDHEITNNWSPSKQLDSRYTLVTDVNELVTNGTRAFLEYAPIRFGQDDDNGRIYRKINYGADLDLFVLDARSYRAGNSANVQTRMPSTIPSVRR